MTTPWLPVPEGSAFPLHSLPYGIGARPGAAPTPWVALGDHALDLGATEALGLLDGCGLLAHSFAEPALNTFLGQGPEVWAAVRARLTELLTDETAADLLAPVARRRDELTMTVPVMVGDYVDFYSSLHHATNLGRLFRPGGDPLLDNWRQIPVGYHGRSGTIVADGAAIPRPCGVRPVDGVPAAGPTAALDIELEVGFVIGVGSERGVPVPASATGEHLFGVCLINDWSARDIQAFEYQPLGPFLGKSFATSMSPWLVPLAALAPFRVANVVQDPPVAPYLRVAEPWALDLHLEILIESAAMRSAGIAPEVVSRTNAADLYWNGAQQLAHLTANGASTRPGDLFATGTVSGPEPGSEGSLIELTRLGERPLHLADGSTRTFLADGDRVILRGWAGEGDDRLGLGEVSGTVTPAREAH